MVDTGVLRTSRTGEDAATGTLVGAGGSARGAGPVGNALVVFKKTKHTLPAGPGIHCPWCLPKGVEDLCPQKNLHATFMAALFVIAGTWTGLRSPGRWCARAATRLGP